MQLSGGVGGRKAGRLRETRRQGRGRRVAKSTLSEKARAGSGGGVQHGTAQRDRSLDPWLERNGIGVESPGVYADNTTEDRAATGGLVGTCKPLP
jgi:hypothetical protein